MKINLKLKVGFEDLGVPKYGTSDSAASDLKAAVEESVVLKPGESKLIPTGIYAETPVGFMLHVTPRSGLALKNGISLVNSPGIIDADYRGEIGVIMINHGKEDFVVERGDRIAQMSVVPVHQAEFEQVEELSDTGRGHGGFGHTGHK